MKEIDVQTKMVHAIREMGGFAQKTSNRFLVGVPDILCQLPGHPTSFWEVKYSNSARYRCPNPTPKQKMWLRDYIKAGGVGGVVYFCQGKFDLKVAMRWAWEFDMTGNLDNKWRIEELDFRTIPRGSKMQLFKAKFKEMHECLM